MNQSNLSKYGVVKVTTCSPGQLLVMLYDALFRFLREGVVAMETKDRARANDRVTRALAILEQLLLGLNREALPTLYDKLSPLYGFCMSHITAANLHQDPAKLSDVIRILSPLREAWGIAVAQVTAGAAAGNRDSVHGETRAPKAANVSTAVGAVAATATATATR